jgi:hypothetical protein
MLLAADIAKRILFALPKILDKNGLIFGNIKRISSFRSDAERAPLDFALVASQIPNGVDETKTNCINIGMVKL